MLLVPTLESSYQKAKHTMHNQPKQPHALIWPLDKLDIHVANGGRRKRVAPGAIEQLLRISGDSAASAHLTVTLFQETSESEIVTPPATAILKWGGSGTQTTAEVDFKNGCAVTLSAAFIEVMGRNDGLIDTELGAFIGYMPYFREWSATKTMPIPAAGGGTDANVIIPDFAIAFSVAINPFNSIDHFDFLDGAGAVIGGTAVSVGGAINRSYAIPNDARSVNVRASAIPIVNGRMIFGLSL